MYKTRGFNERACRFVLRYFGVYMERCNVYTVKRFPQWPDLVAVENQMAKCWICGMLGFPVVYYIVLAISVIGIANSFKEFVKGVRGRNSSVSVWRQRKYYLFTNQFLQKSRILGALVNLYSWVQLAVSLLLGKPHLMASWLLIHMSLLIFEGTIWLFEIVFTATKPELYTLVKFLLSLANCAFVCYVRKIMDQAVVFDNLQGLKVWPLRK